MFDASYPCESYGTTLPPPPPPAVAAALTASGKVVPPTTKGHLHYGPIPGLIGAIDSINLEKEDEEFNDLQHKISGLSAGTGSSAAIHTNLEMVPSKQYHYHSNVRRQEGEPYEFMPLAIGVICSRSTSGRVLYRIAKHIEGLLH